MGVVVVIVVVQRGQCGPGQLALSKVLFHGDHLHLVLPLELLELLLQLVVLFLDSGQVLLCKQECQLARNVKFEQMTGWVT